MIELAFERSEYQARIDRALAAMRVEGLDALLLFQQESMYYLFGYDQIGYWVYQTILLPADGSGPTALCRRADELMIRDSPFIEDVRTWWDDGDRDPSWSTAQLLEDRNLLSPAKRVGIEKKSHALLAYYYDLLREHTRGRAQLIDASDAITELRLIKSPAEMAYMRRAGQIMDQAFAAAFEAIRPGARECDVNAAVMSTMSSLGADFPAVAPPIAFGERTLTQTHGAATERPVRLGDAFTIEIGVPYKRYHSVAVHSGVAGEPQEELQDLFHQLNDGIEAGLEVIGPGVTTAAVASTVIGRLEAHGLPRKGRHVGYGIGIGYPPSWIDNLRIKETDTHVLREGMTFFLFVAARTKTGERCLYLGEPLAVTGTTVERLSALPRELRVIPFP